MTEITQRGSSQEKICNQLMEISFGSLSGKKISSKTLLPLLSSSANEMFDMMCG
jgi:hypothetical protein